MGWYGAPPISCLLPPKKAAPRRELGRRSFNRISLVIWSIARGDSKVHKAARHCWAWRRKALGPPLKDRDVNCEGFTQAKRQSNSRLWMKSLKMRRDVIPMDSVRQMDLKWIFLCGLLPLVILCLPILFGEESPVLSQGGLFHQLLHTASIVDS